MKMFKLEGTSMSPLFKAGDIVLVEDNSHQSPVTSHQPDVSSTPYPLPSTLSPGDCAVYDFKGRRLLHRVIGKEAGGLWLSDDAGRLEPHFVRWENIEGKVLSGNPLKNGCTGQAYSKLKRLASGFFLPLSAKGEEGGFEQRS